MIAAKTQTPLLPVCLWGSHRVLPKGAKFPRPHPLTIRIAPPIPPPPKGSDRATLEAITGHCAEVIHEMHELGR